tara:strand:- start:51 stop:278 length:228 start_codon:yes stop_codon:yes gene_type:complete
MKMFLKIIVFGFALSGCGDSSSDYDKGYEDAWKGYSPKSNSNFYLEGYEDGEFNADCDQYKRNGFWDKYKNLGCK